MSETTILVIDDSSTIRRLVDKELSSAGYRVLLAPTAEDGLNMARTERPDLIILDHQLPGTTGLEVCLKLLEDDQLSSCPVVISSTLRKKAYVEYVDASNVVDMLPKPYTSDLLITTVENALGTAQMVVESQSQGSAVPETIEEQAAGDLQGNCETFGVREVLDMLNNGSKQGVVEFESNSYRIWIYVDEGRIQAVTAAGVDPEEVAKLLPNTLDDLSPLTKFTVGGRRCAEVDGLVELLDNKVLDARLLGKLMRIQAAVLLRKCFLNTPESFRFTAGTSAPSLFARIPLSISLLGLLVEGALVCDADELPEIDDFATFSRKSMRGQSLDRTGLSTVQLQLVKLLSSPMSIERIAKQIDLEVEELHRILHGFELAELIERKSENPGNQRCQVLVVGPTDENVVQIQKFFQQRSAETSLVVLNSWLAASLSMKRNPPNLLLATFDDQSLGQARQFAKLQQDYEQSDTQFVALHLGSEENFLTLKQELPGMVLDGLDDSCLERALSQVKPNHCAGNSDSRVHELMA